jgi:hypothetical protein
VDARLRQTRAAGRDREQRLWAEEVARTLGATASLKEPARGTVMAVLRSLAADPLESPATRRDAQALLEALETNAAPETALPDPNNHQTHTTLRKRLTRGLVGAA